MDFFQLLMLIQQYLFYVLFPIAAFLFALLYKNKGRLYYAFVFLAAATVIIELLPSYSSTAGFYFSYAIVAAALIITAFLHKGKHTLLYVWLSEILKTLFALFWSWYFASFYVDFYYFILIMLPFELGFLIALTVIRARREKRERLESVTQQSSPEGYYSERVGANGMLIAGNVMSFISLVLTITFVSIICNYAIAINEEYDYYIGYGVIHPDSLNMGLGITCIVIAGILSIISVIMLKRARTYGHTPTPIDTALYIWSWMIPIVIIAIMAFVVLVISTAGGGGIQSFNEKTKKQIYTVKDENGEKRKLDYKGGLCEQCPDDKGNVWETSDGGSTFVKRDYYKIKDESGEEHTLHNYGMDTSGQYYVDKDGKEYKSTDGGSTASETGNDSPFNANYY